MTLTQSRVLQYIGIILICGILAGGYWYFHSQASTLNAPGGDSLNKDLVGYWKLDDGSGTTATDSSTNGNNGTLVSSPAWSTGRIGGAVTFDGVWSGINTSDHIALPIAPATAIGTGSFTASAWIKTTTAAYTPILDTFYISGSHILYLASTGKLYTYLNYGGGITSTGRAVNDNQWHHIAITRTGSNCTGYVDGALDFGPTDCGNASINGGTSDFHIGMDYGNTRVFNGSIDEVRLYGWPLSADEISKLYTLTTPTGVDTSLKGYWSFDGKDISGTTAYDRSGAGNNGTLTNSPTIVDGKVGQALSFDGSNDKVSFGSASSIKFGAGNFSYSIWMKTPVSGTAIIMAENKAENPLREIYIDSSGLPVFSYRDATANAVSVAGPVSVANNNWHYLVGTRSGSTGYLYVDGVLVGSNTNGSVGDTNTSSGNLVLGFRENGGGDLFYTGLLDEARVYNRALSASEIQALYTEGGGSKMNSSVSQPQGTGRLDSGLAGYWKLDDGSGTNATDSSTNGNNGTLTNGPTWTTGQIGGAVQFDGSNDSIEISSVPALNGTFTYSAWINLNSTPGGTVSIADKGSNLRNLEILGGGYLSFWTGFNAQTTTTVSTSIWHHVVGLYDGTTTRLYVDGVLSNSATGTTSSDSANTLSIGGFGGARYFPGKIDEVRIYNRALSADEISKLYTLTTPTGVDTSLKGYWSFNGQDISGTTAYDRSGAGNNGTLTNGPTATTGKVGQALSFDGTNDYVDLGTGSAIRFTTSGSISAWIKTGAAPSGYRVIIGGDSATETGYSFALNAGNLKFRINKDDYNAIQTAWTGVYDDNNFHLITVTKAGATAILYVDGLQKASIGSMGSATWSTQTVYIGNEYDRSYNFPGSIDEVRIYNRALSASEIQALYLQGNGSKENSSVSQLQGTGRLDSGLAGYWKLDDGSGTNATDSSTNGNNGTLTNGPTWTTGKIGGAVNFDASNDEISMGSSASTQDLALGPMSVSLWFNATETQNGDLIGRNDGNTINQGWAILYTQPSNRFTFAAECSTLNVYKHVTMPSANVWHHAVVTYDGSVNASGVSIYIDGALQAPVATQNCSGARGSDSSRSLKMGYTGYYGYYGGSLDEVRIYRRIVSPDEVRQLYNLTAPTGVDTSLKGYWSFNGQDISGTTAYDRSGAGNNGTLLNGLSVAPAKIGQGIKSNYPTSSNQGVSVSASASLNNLNQKTLSVWMYPKSTGPSCLGMAYSKYYWSLGYSGCGGTLDFGQVFSSTSGHWRVNSTPTYNEWHLVTITYDNTSVSNDPIIYIDGVPAALSETSTPAGTASSDVSSGLYIGNNTNGNGSFDGILDEFRIYNRILSAGEVAALYNQGR